MFFLVSGGVEKMIVPKACSMRSLEKVQRSALRVVLICAVLWAPAYGQSIVASGEIFVKKKQQNANGVLLLFLSC